MTTGILKKILYIQQNLEVEKTGYDDRQDFHYYRAEDVATAVRIAMNGQGIIHRTEILETREDNKWDQNGRNRPRVSFTARVTFVDPEDGSEFSTDVVATGSDTGGDKGPRKAQVQAFKIAALDLFIITEDMGKFDSDGDKESEPINMNAAPPADARKTIAEYTKMVGEFVNDESNAIDAAKVAEIAVPIAEKKGVGTKSSVWRKDAEVMLEVVAELTKIAAKTAATGEV